MEVAGKVNAGVARTANKTVRPSAHSPLGAMSKAGKAKGRMRNFSKLALGK